MASSIDFLLEPRVRNFILENLQADVSKLLLNPPREFKAEIKSIANQILARQKAKGKLDDWVGHPDLLMPPPLSMEQASSQTTARYKQHLVSGTHLVDLTGGTGIDCLAISERFEKATFVEQQHELCAIFSHNIRILGRDIEVIHSSAEAFLEKFSPTHPTLFYLDPSRRGDEKQRVFRISECSPNLLQLLPILEQKASKVMVKYSPLLDISSILSQIRHVKEIHVVSVKNECKELLLLIDFSFMGDSSIHCVNLESNHPTFTFNLAMEQKSKAEIGSLQKYIYEPNSSILKAGAFSSVAAQFHLLKISPNTHLYTSSEIIRDFPGRIYEVIEKVNKASLKNFAPDGKINVITRNYPQNALELKRKWKLRDGGNYFLIAFKDVAQKPHMYIATRKDL